MKTFRLPYDVFWMAKSRQREPEYFTTAEVAEFIGVTKQTLLNWLRRGLITEPERNSANGYRRWTEKDVQAIRQFLRDRRFRTVARIDTAQYS